MVSVYDVCQRVGKSSRPQVAPLMNLPLMEEAFQRLSFDIVGPLPVTKSGNRFILIVLDHFTHYPFAVPLQSHTAEDVINCLIQVFTQFNFCSDLVTDTVSELKSDLLKAVLEKFDIKHMKISAYHPQANPIERFHRVLKDITRPIVDKNVYEWETVLPWIVYAYREVPVETLGFSPFELLFGKNPREMLTLIRHAWTSNDADVSTNKRNVVEYMLT